MSAWISKFMSRRANTNTLNFLALALLVVAMLVTFQNCSVPMDETTDSSSVSSSSASSHITLISTPSDTSVVIGGSTTLTVSARSKDGKSLSYQWYFSGTAISGATSTQLALTTVTAGQGGSYWAVVSDGTYSLSTYAATVTVYSPSEAQLSFTQQPSAQIITGGLALYLESNASDNIGSAISYQWYRNGTVISGATAAEYYIAQTSHTNDTGYYYVRASNGYTTIKSSTVYIAVSVNCSSGSQYNGHCYIVHTTALNFASAAATCATDGGHLVKIDSGAENSVVTSLIPSTAWTGASDQVSEGTFLWRDGVSASYTNWLSGQPDNSNNEDCASIQTSGGWNDLACTAVLPYVCEYE